MSLLAVFSVRARFFHRQIVLTIDFLLAAAFFWLQSRVGSTPSWVGLIPILTGAVYFEALGAFIVAPLFAIWQTVIGEGVFYNDFTFLREVGMTLLAGFVAGIGGRFVMRRLRTSRQTKLDVEERQRRMESERLRAIYELSSTLTATLSYRRVLDSALDLAYTALNPNPDPDEPTRRNGWSARSFYSAITSCALARRGGSPMRICVSICRATKAFSRNCWTAAMPS